jgi:hypothetical protein
MCVCPHFQSIPASIHGGRARILYLWWYASPGAAADQPGVQDWYIPLKQVCHRLTGSHRLTAPISTVTGANRLIPGGSFGKVLTCCCLKTLKRVFLTHKPTSIHCSALTVEIQLQPGGFWLAGLFTNHSRDCNCAIPPINAQFVFRAIFLICFAGWLRRSVLDSLRFTATGGC